MSPNPAVTAAWTLSYPKTRYAVSDKTLAEHCALFAREGRPLCFANGRLCVGEARWDRRRREWRPLHPQALLIGTADGQLVSVRRA